MKRIIIIVLALAIVLGFLFWKFGPDIASFLAKNKSIGPVTLTYWGLWEDDNLIKPVIAEFEKQNPNIKVNYVRESSINYRTRVQTQIRSGVGPDVFWIHNSWLPMFDGDLAPSPREAFTAPDYQNTFYPVAAASFIKGGNIFAAPTEIDGLGLYYNEDLLAGVGTPPKSWREFIDEAVKMTVKDSKGQIQTAGAALGTAANVDHWQDILGLLILQQPGASLENPASSAVAEVFSFYTGFVTDPKKKTWDVSLPSSTQMFEEGRLGFYFAPSWRAHELRVANPNLKFKVIEIPQLSSTPAAWATFWGIGVAQKSSHVREAWQFIKFLTSAQAEKTMYQGASQVRLFGEPYSRMDLAQDLIADPIVGAFISQGPNYKSWYLSSNTYDAGLNDEMSKYFEDGINATLQGNDPQVALQTVAKGVTQVLDKYTKPAAPAPSGQ